MRLCDTETLSQCEHYVTLSYCWGSDDFTTTTRANIDNHREKIPLAILGQAIIDAVYVTKKLDIRYLWVDALCICQDDEAELHAEAANMSNVYGGSSLTISSMSSPRVMEGFLADRTFVFAQLGQTQTSHDRPNDSMQLYVRRIPRHIDDELHRSRLNHRAWALQERILSPSVIHYCPDQMIWECNTQHLLSETGARETSGDTVIRLSDRAGAAAFMGRRDLWDSIVNAYSGRKLTRLEDRLRAISGVAARFRIDGIRQDRYVAGLWENDLDFQLAWRSENWHLIQGQVLKTDPSVPTWSWAHWNKSAALDYRSGLTSALTKAPKFVLPEQEEGHRAGTAERTGPLPMIRLSGYLQRVGDTAIRTETNALLCDNGRTDYTGLPGQNSRWDFDTETFGTGPHYCLRLVENGFHDELPHNPATYLVLKASRLTHASGSPIYQRVGVLSLRNLAEEDITRPYPDIFFKNGKPFLTDAKEQEILLI